MPVRSSGSSVLVWPDRARVDEALRAWAAREAPRHEGLIRLGVFGSFVGERWGVGSDLDLIAIVRRASERFDRRALAWEITSLPVSADLVVYTEEEWAVLKRRGARLAETVEREARWLYP